MGAASAVSCRGRRRRGRRTAAGSRSRNSTTINPTSHPWRGTAAGCVASRERRGSRRCRSTGVSIDRGLNAAVTTGRVTEVKHPLVQHKLSYLRDKDTPTVHFRKLANELTLLLTYEATKDFPTETVEIETPLERMPAQRISGKKVAVCPVLRAGMGMLDGFLSLVSGARVGFIGLYRDEETLEPVEYYVKLPADLERRDAIVLDPMLATGNSSAAAVSTVKDAGAQSVTLVCLVAAPEGIEHLHSLHPDVHIVCAAIDRGLNERGFIVPGLGDAGDRLYGTK
ncbi:MAG: uracil phosphoribosyltransferase [Actinobacteria bacterium]|nr:MAG: uracil phosphoribosyltransferase [Actinomycetota bacterium]